MTAIEKPIAQRVKEHLNFRPYILDSLEEGYGNLSRISEIIATDLKLDKSEKKGAIKAALRRLSITIKKERKEREARVLQVLRGSRLETKYDVNALTLRSGLRLERPSHQDLILSTEFADGNFYVVGKIQKKDNVYLVAGQKIEAENMLSYHPDCTMFIVKSSKETIEDTPGVLAFLNSIFATQNINVIEFISCYTYTILIVDREDEVSAFAALRQIIGKKKDW